MKRNMTDDLIQLNESEDFWQKSRDKLLMKLISKEPVLDVGCGVGVVTKQIMNKGFKTYSTDIDVKAVNETKKINENVFISDFSKPIKEKIPKMGSILMADSLEHIKEDVMAIKNANKLLKIDGELIISVPYSQVFWTKNDDVRYHIRRYSKKELRKKLEDNGFKVKSLNFWGTLFLGPILLAKLFNFRLPHEQVSKSKLNNILYKYMLFENVLPKPIGSAIICKAVKVRDL